MTDSAKRPCISSWFNPFFFSLRLYFFIVYLPQSLHTRANLRTRVTIYQLTKGRRPSQYGLFCTLPLYSRSCASYSCKARVHTHKFTLFSACKLLVILIIMLQLNIPIYTHATRNVALVFVFPVSVPPRAPFYPSPPRNIYDIYTTTLYTVVGYPASYRFLFILFFFLVFFHLTAERSDFVGP